MSLKKQGLPLGITIGIFILIYYLPVERIPLDNFITESLYLARWYAREHVLLCLVPAFFIAGAISVFISQNSVIKYLGPTAAKFKAYGVASVSGSILAVCSCTILPLFAGIFRMGAGIGPATAFLYAGPAVNILAVVLTARILGLEMGVARAVGAVLFSIIIGILMQLIFPDKKPEDLKPAQISDESSRPLWQNIIYFALMAGVLIFANWHSNANSGLSFTIFTNKWLITGILSLLLGLVLILWFNLHWLKVSLVSIIVIVLSLIFNEHPVIPFTAGAIGLSVILIISGNEPGRWFDATWDLSKQILPLLLIGVVVAGALLGRPDGRGLIPPEWIHYLVGGNSIGAVFVAAIVGAFMYFATLTEVPILQGLIASGMGKGPALALLLAGPALSLPNMLVIRSIMGTKKTIVFVALVVIMATICGILYGTLL